MTIIIIFFIFYKFLFFFYDFLEIQRASFYQFLKYQFRDELLFDKFNLKNQFCYNFIYNKYKFIRPKFDIKQSIFSSKTYCSNFYILVKFSYFNESRFQWVFLGTLPLLTRRGHFIINGIPRIMINQIVRSPGIYFKKKKKYSYYAEVIFQYGSWIRLEIDSEKKIWIYFQEMSQLTLETFLKKFNQKYKDNIYFNNIFDSLDDEIYTFTKRNFILGKFGRLRLNQKLNICLDDLNLTPIDLVVISNYLYRSCEQLVDDIDNLKNRRIKTVGELIQEQLARGLFRLREGFFSKKKKFNQIIKKSKNFYVLEKLINLKVLNCISINSTFKEFFHSHQLSQFLDQSNPLAEITHKRRLSCLGAGGISTENASMEIRGIHRTHYGRICPIETPEGINAGLVNSLTISAKKNFQGFLETPFVENYKQHSQNHKKILFFSVEKQMSQNVFFNPILKKLKNLAVPVVKTQSQNQYNINSIKFWAFSPQQFISIGTNCIPFIEHNDANRALMGSNMQRQSLPLLQIEKPIVNTINSFRVISDLRDIPISNESGIIFYISSKINKISYQKIYGFYKNKKILSLSKSNICWLEKIFFNFSN